MEAKVDTRKLAKSLRYLPKAEVDKYCTGCGMSDREKRALIDYLYNLVKQSDLCERLGMSRSSFIRHEKVLAIKLLRYMVSIGAIDEIVTHKSTVGDMVSDLELFGRK